MNPKNLITLYIGQELKHKSKIQAALTGQSISDFIRHALQLWTNNQLFLLAYKDKEKLPDGQGLIFQICKDSIMSHDVQIIEPDGVRILCLKQK